LSITGRKRPIFEDLIRLQGLGRLAGTVFRRHPEYRFIGKAKRMGHRSLHGKHRGLLKIVQVGLPAFGNHMPAKGRAYEISSCTKLRPLHGEYNPASACQWFAIVDEKAVLVALNS
jgi:hypothetical protein